MKKPDYRENFVKKISLVAIVLGITFTVPLLCYQTKGCCPGPQGPPGVPGGTGPTGATGVAPTPDVILGCEFTFLFGTIPVPASGTISGSGNGYTYTSTPTQVTIFYDLSTFDTWITATAEGLTGPISLEIQDEVGPTSAVINLSAPATAVDFIISNCLTA